MLIYFLKAVILGEIEREHFYFVYYYIFNHLIPIPKIYSVSLVSGLPVTIPPGQR